MEELIMALTNANTKDRKFSGVIAEILPQINLAKEQGYPVLMVYETVVSFLPKITYTNFSTLVSRMRKKGKAGVVANPLNNHQVTAETKQVDDNSNKVVIGRKKAASTHERIDNVRNVMEKLYPEKYQ